MQMCPQVSDIKRSLIFFPFSLPISWSYRVSFALRLKRDVQVVKRRKQLRKAQYRQK